LEIFIWRGVEELENRRTYGARDGAVNSEGDYIGYYHMIAHVVFASLCILLHLTIMMKYFIIYIGRIKVMEEKDNKLEVIF